MRTYAEWFYKRRIVLKNGKIASVENETEEVEATEETESTEAEPEFTVTAMEATKYAKKSVNVRKGHSTE